LRTGSGRTPLWIYLTTSQRRSICTYAILLLVCKVLSLTNLKLIQKWLGDESLWSTKVRHWAKYLKQDTIASGLNPFCSRINPTDFESIRSNTNAVEVAHWRGNSVGRRCTLLQAILKFVLTILELVLNYSRTISNLPKLTSS
jgi:hypothetical protein